MSSEFTNRKLAWLEAVARERTLPRSAVALAILLACRFFNGEVRRGVAERAHLGGRYRNDARERAYWDREACRRGCAAQAVGRPAHVEPLPSPAALAGSRSAIVGKRAALLWAIAPAALLAISLQSPCGQ